MIEDKSGIFLAGAHKKARTPKIAPEGILAKIGGGKKAISRTQIQVLDLVSEGELEGLVSGQFYYSGQSGDIGYVSGSFKPYGAFEAKSSAAGESIDVASSDNVRWLRSVYWNDVPLVDSSEQLNYANIDMAMVLGTADGLRDDDESSFSRDVTRSATKTRVISERLRGPNFDYSNLGRGHSSPSENFDELYDPKNPDSDGHRRAIINQRKYRVLNKNCAAVQVNIKIASLQYREMQNAKKMGDARDSTIKYMIQVKPIFTVFSEMPEAVRSTFNRERHESCTGRITKGFVNSTQISLPNLSEREDFLGWEVTVIRKTFDSLDSRYENTSFVDSLTEIYRSSFSYPHSAIVSSKFSAEFFSQIPSRKFDMRMKKVKLPSNYNPLLRNYGQISGGARYQGSTGLSQNDEAGKTLTPDFSFHRNANGTVSAGTEIGSWDGDQDAIVDLSVESDANAPDTTSDYSQSVSQVVLNISGLSQEELGDYTVNGTTDVWDGTFKEFDQWTDNPAWVFYDLLINKRYGLGDYVDEDDIDKWSLYKIGQYCDQLVPDGEGGLEPRFSANILLNTREESFKVINNMASIFRGIAYYGQGSIFAVQDSLKDPVMVFNNSNVVNGIFNYQSSNKKARHNIAVVKYLDRNEFYRPAVEYVKDIEGIKKYGEREVEVTAYGATSKTQAMRWGRWTLLTENMQTETVGFNAGLEGAYLRPGDIFRVSDSNRSEYKFGGRLSGIRINDDKGAVITLDRYMSFEGMKNVEGEDMGSGVLSLMAPTYHYDPVTTTIGDSRDIDDIRRSQVLEYTFWTGHALGSDHDDAHGYISRMSGPSGEFRNGLIEITLTGTKYEADYINTGNYDLGLNASEMGTIPLTYTIHDPVGSNPEPQLYSALSVREADGGQIEVMGLQYETGKFAEVETDFESQIPESPFHSKLPPKKPDQVTVSFRNGQIVYSAKVKQKTEKDEQGKEVTYDDPDHNTSNIFVYQKFEAQGKNPLLKENFFLDVERNQLGSPNSPKNDNYADHFLQPFSTRSSLGVMEDTIAASKTPGLYSFAFFSMNYYGEFSEGVFQMVSVDETQVDQSVQDIEIAGLHNSDDLAVSNTIGGNADVYIQDSTLFTMSWSVNTLGTSINFLGLYGILGASKSIKGDPLPTASEMFYLMTIRSVDHNSTNGLGSLYNFKDFPTYAAPWASATEFTNLDSSSNVSNAKFVRKCFEVSSTASDPVKMNSREIQISIKDLLDFTDSNGAQLNYLYEYGPPREFDIVVEVINKSRGKTSASADGLGRYPTADLSTSDDDAGTNTGWDRVTISNPRIPTFLLRKPGDAEITTGSFSAYSVSSNAYTAANVDINSEKAFVTKNNKFYLLLQNYEGVKAPASSAGKGYWIEVDSICVATISRPEKRILSIKPNRMIYYTRAASPVLKQEDVSSDGFASERLADIANGGFIVYMSNVKNVSGTSYFDRGQIYGLASIDSFKTSESITRKVGAQEVQNEDGTITQKTVDQEIAAITEKFEPDDSMQGEGDSDIDQESFEIKIPDEVIDSPSKFFCVYPYDTFDGSVINAYGKRTEQSIEYRRKAIALSNVVDLSWGS